MGKVKLTLLEKGLKSPDLPRTCLGLAEGSLSTPLSPSKRSGEFRGCNCLGNASNRAAEDQTPGFQHGGQGRV